MAISIDDALKTLLIEEASSAEAYRAMLHELLGQVHRFHNCRWIGVVDAGEDELYELAELRAEQQLGVVYHALESDTCLAIDVIASGNLGFGTSGDEETTRLTVLFEDAADDWTKTTVSVDSYDELDLSLAEAWEQLSDRPVLAVFWDG